MLRRPPRSTLTDTLLPYTTLFRSLADRPARLGAGGRPADPARPAPTPRSGRGRLDATRQGSHLHQPLRPGRLEPGGGAAARGVGQHQGADRARPDRKSVVSGKSVYVRVDLGGRRIIKKNKYKQRNNT